MRGDLTCVGGRLMRHDPQFDDPELETDIGECPDCGGEGCGEWDGIYPERVPKNRQRKAASDPNTIKALVEAAKNILTHACIADAAPEDVDDEDRQLERALRGALRPFMKEGE